MLVVENCLKGLLKNRKRKQNETLYSVQMQVSWCGWRREMFY